MRLVEYLGLSTSQEACSSDHFIPRTGSMVFREEPRFLRCRGAYLGLRFGRGQICVRGHCRLG